MNFRASSRLFVAQYEGECAFCGAGIEAGTRMGLVDGENEAGHSVERAPACSGCWEDAE